jgi:hypothetical protein
VLPMIAILELPDKHNHVAKRELDETSLTIGKELALL